MTCTFTLAIPSLAIVCADTRISFGQANGGQMKDVGAFSIQYKDKIELLVKDHDRKIRRYPGGWAAGSGSFAVVESCLTHLGESNARTPAAIKIVLKHAFDSIYEEMKDEFIQGAQINPTIITYIYRTLSGFRLGGFSIDDRIVIPDTQQYYFSTPPDVSNAVVIQAQLELQPKTEGDLPFGLQSKMEEDLPSLIKRIARAFHTVHMASSTVSDILDMAISTREGGSVIQSRLLQTNESLIDASNDQILRLLKPVS
jgi:hypothetical protein